MPTYFRLILLSIFLSLSSMSPSFAQEKVAVYLLGYGNTSCKDYRESIRALNQPKIRFDKMNSAYFKSWAAGFLSAIDMGIFQDTEKRLSIQEFMFGLPKNTRDHFIARDYEDVDFFGTNNTTNDLWDELNQYCKNNINKQAIDALQAYIESWYPKHLISIENPQEKEGMIVQLPHAGIGLETCAQYNQSRKTRNSPKAQLKYFYMPLAISIDSAADDWVQGFVTSANMISALKNNKLLDQESKAIASIDALRHYCSSHPESRIYEFASEYVVKNAP